MPKLGQSMEAATIVSWHASEGDTVDKGQVIVTVETDKATYELEAPATGPLRILVPEGDEVAVEVPIAAVGDVEVPAQRTPEALAPSVSAPAKEEAAPRHGRVLASPRAKRLAAEKGIDLSTVRASAADGMISVEDVERALAGQAQAASSAPAAAGARAIREQRKLTGIKRTTARRVQQAWQTIPHIVQMVEVDASGLLAERRRLQSQGIEASVNDVLLLQAARTMADHPELNATVEEETLLFYEGVDIGFAVDTPRGLLVPVIRGADSMDAAHLVAESKRLVDASREAGLKEGEAGNASLTVSNLGMFGIRAGTPIINLGEPVLVFAGAIEDRPIAIDGQVQIRPTMELSIAYDHRVADGVQAAQLTQALKRAVESLAGAGEPPGTAAGKVELAPRELRASSAGDGYNVALDAHGGFHFELDEPGSIGGTDRGPTPVDAFLGGLLGCMIISFKAAARRHEVSIDHVGGRVHANRRGRLREITVELDITTSAPEDDVRELVSTAERWCYVSNVIKPEIDYRVETRIHRPAG